MPIRLTDELKAEALAVAQLYEPLRDPLLVGSCVWLGEGNDIDVVVFVEDASLQCGGERCSPNAYGPMTAYRHGVVNIIAVECERMWAGWEHAAKVMPTVPRDLIADKDSRVAECEKLRAIGESNCLFD